MRRARAVSDQIESFLCRVIPAKAGIQYTATPEVTGFPAFAGNDSGVLVAKCRFQSTGIRSSTHLVAALLAGLAAALTAGGASAAVWHWACQGELGDQRILFDRDGLYIAGGKAPAGKPGKVTAESIQEAIVLVKKDGGFTEFAPDDGNGGLESPITFSRTDDNKQTQKVVFTERSSKRISHRHRIVACRDEDTDLYRKAYRYQRDGEPARDITMQCMEYQLSTKGGRKDCD